MSDDPLLTTSRALRAELLGSGDVASTTRARIMASLHQTQRRRRTKLAFLLPIAAVLIGSTAWAAATGRLPTRLTPEPPAKLERPSERVRELVRSAPQRAAAVRQPAATPDTPAVQPSAAPASPAKSTGPD